MSDTLTLLPPNATATERALARVVGRTTALAVGPKYRALWNPQTCPAGILPWLASALRVVEWDSNWTEQQKRDVIASSVAVLKTKGTIGALKRALAALGYEVTVDENTGEVYTFRLEFDLNQTGIIGTDTFAAARRVAMANKNARSKLLAVRSSLTANAGVYGAVAHHRAQTVTVDCGRWDLPPDEHTLLQVQVDAAGNIVERTGNGTITTSGTVIVDHTTTHDGFGSIRNTAAGSTTAAGYVNVATSLVLTGDFTVEGYCKALLTSAQTSGSYFGSILENGRFDYYGNGSYWELYLSVDFNGPGSYTTILGDTDFHHFAIVRKNGVFLLFINGKIGTGTNTELSDTIIINSVVLGRSSRFSSGIEPCCIENIRISDIARYTANFTPPGRL